MGGWERVRSLVAESDFWAEFVHREELKSTNSYLRSKDKLPVGAIVLAERQTSGRGRGTARWYSPEGGLWFSVKLSDSFEKSAQEFYVDALRLLRDLLADYGVETEISRPNDLVAEGKKLAGILIEEHDGEYVVGFGLNVNNDLSVIPEKVGENSITMQEITGEEIDRDELLSEFLSRFEVMFNG